MSRKSVSVAAPASTNEPLSLDEVKKVLDIANNDTSQDSELIRLRKDARLEFENDTGRLTSQRAVTEALDSFPSVFTLDWGPVASITSIKYYDTANVQQTLSSAVYSLDANNRKIHEAVDQEWPATETRWDAVEVIYLAGETTTNEQAKQTMLIKITEMFGDEPQQRLDGLNRAYESKMVKQARSSYP